MPTFPAIALLSLVACVAVAPLAHAADAPGFDAERAESQKNLRTSTGSKYDQVLGTYLQSQADIKAGMNQCLKANPPPQTLRGYFRFAADGSYHLLLQPAGAFADCFKGVFEGHKLPPPPQLPYLNDFNFSTSK